MNCRLCQSEKLTQAYEGAIRSGGANSEFEEGYRVFHCETCGVEFLDPFPPQHEDFYESDAYWHNRLPEKEEARLVSRFADEQTIWFEAIGYAAFAGKRVVDIGCGAGMFLDLVDGVASETVGVDASPIWEKRLAAHGHQYVQQLEQLKGNNLELGVSFDTLEHVPEPIAFLKQVRSVLGSGATFYIGVPNQTDFLKRLVPDYLPFFYHKSHLFYFSAASLTYALEQASFAVQSVRSIHKYDLMNMIIWAHDRRGAGKPGSDVFDAATERSFRLNLERQGIGSHILAVAETA